jgi:2-oxoglutarate/2-oxoacid ferredoxin oxidoreductase subunit beta
MSKGGRNKMKVVYDRPQTLTGVNMHYCPGCTHGIIHRLVAEVIDELGLREQTIGVCPVGCSVLAYNYFNLDMQQASHGRAPAVATGIKRVLPDKTVFTYQGDGDLASIGAAEIIHAAARGEKITTIFVNNAIYGMTGGQMAPTTLVGQETTTSPKGRDAAVQGYPIRVAEMLATLEGAAYIARVSVHNAVNVNKAKAAIKKAFQLQQQGLGFGLVEVLSTCPTNWGYTPVEALKWLENNMLPYYPLGEFKTPKEVQG